MGICFIGERRMKCLYWILELSLSFLQNYLDVTPGDIYSVNGELLGRHDGLAFYTIGQGMKLSNSHVKYYICEKHVDSNTLVVCEKMDPRLFHSSFEVGLLHYIINRSGRRIWLGLIRKQSKGYWNIARLMMDSPFSAKCVIKPFMFGVALSSRASIHVD